MEIPSYTKGGVSHPWPAWAQHKEQAASVTALLPYLARDRLIPNCSHPDSDAKSLPLPNRGIWEHQSPLSSMAGNMQVQYMSAYIQVIPIQLLLKKPLITAFKPTPEVRLSFSSQDQLSVAPTIPSQRQAGPRPRGHRRLQGAVLVHPCRSTPAGNPEKAVPSGEEPAGGRGWKRRLGRRRLRARDPTRRSRQPPPAPLLWATSVWAGSTPKLRRHRHVTSRELVPQP